MVIKHIITVRHIHSTCLSILTVEHVQSNNIHSRDFNTYSMFLLIDDLIGHNSIIVNEIPYHV